MARPGLLTAQGEAWTRQKRFVQPVFTQAAVEGYGDLMVDEILRVVGDRAARHGVVDLAAEMQELTLRVVVRALFGSPQTPSSRTYATPSRSCATPSSAGA